MKSNDIIKALLVLSLLLCTPLESLAEFNTGGYSVYIKPSVTGWEDDYKDLVSALQDNNYNTYGYPAMEELYAEPAAPYGDGSASRFEQLLKATDGTGIKIFAVFSETHFYSKYCTVYWIEKYHAKMGTTCNELDYNDGIGTTTADAELLRQHWKEALKLAMEWLSGLAVTYPHLVAATVDDFGTHVDSPIAKGSNTSKQYYSAADVAEITAAGKVSGNVKFWPTYYYGFDMASNFSPGYTLGQEYASLSYPGDWVSVDFTFTLKSKPSAMSLNMLIKDMYDDFLNDGSSSVLRAHKNKLYKVVRLNGADIDSSDFWGANGIERKSILLDTSKLKICASTAGSTCEQNTLSIGMYAKDTTNTNDLRYGIARVLKIWGLRIKKDGKDFTDFTTSFTIPSARDTDKDGNPDYYAEANTNYNVVSAVDGVLAVLPADASYYDPVTYDLLFQESKAALGSKDLIVVSYGDLSPNVISPTQLKMQIAKSAKYAQGSIVWNPPLEIWQLSDKGIFAEKASLSTSYDVMAYWAGYSMGLTGWHQKWTLPEATGKIDLKTYENGTSGTDGLGEEYFVKSIKDADGNEYYRDGLLGIECNSSATTSSSKTCPGFTAPTGSCTVTCDAAQTYEKISIDLGEKITDLEIKYELTENVGPMGSAYYVEVGAEPDKWVFESGVTDNCHVTTYNAIKDAFASVLGTTTSASTSTSSYTVDSDGDGLDDCADLQPAVYNKWWWLNAGKSTTCLTEDTAYTYSYLMGKKFDATSTPPTTSSTEAATMTKLAKDSGVIFSGVSDHTKSQGTIGCSNTNPSIPEYGIYMELSQ